MNEAITRDILRKVRQIEIRTNRIVADSLAGHYHSVFKGRGMDFDEVREYVPGDEVRTIDWNVTARAGRPFIKKFAEERELTLLLLVDVSASGHFGSGAQSKRDVAAELACVLALSATRNNDKVGLVLFTEQIELYIPPKKGRRHVLRVVREILFFRPTRRGTDLVHALEFANRMSGRRSVVFLISDFQTTAVGADASSALRRALSQSARRHDLVAVNIRDPREQSLPDLGVVILQDAESGEVMEIDTGRRRTRELFATLAQKSRDALLRMLNAEAIDSLMLTTDQPYLGSLISFFRRREARHP
ncbi:MAG TPA: DUF58 domain-containing protein [Steroidobacteraceae bacterium]